MKKLLSLILVLALLLGVTGSVSIAEEEPTIITVAANSLALIFVGAVLVGCSISWDIPQSMLSLTNANAVAAATMACSVAHIGGQIGTFASSLVMTNITGLFGSTVSFRYVFTAVASLIMAVVVFLIFKALKIKA